MEKSPKIDNSYIVVLISEHAMCCTLYGTGRFSLHREEETEVPKGDLLMVT